MREGAFSFWHFVTCSDVNLVSPQDFACALTLRASSPFSCLVGLTLCASSDAQQQCLQLCQLSPVSLASLL